MSGYQHCACRDCFEIAIGDGGPALCHECETAGCDVEGAHECLGEPYSEADELTDVPMPDPCGTPDCFVCVDAGVDPESEPNAPVLRLHGKDFATPEKK